LISCVLPLVGAMVAVQVPTPSVDFRNVRVLVIGDMVADHYLFGQTERVSREAPVLVVRHEHEEVRMGGAANVVANVRALGAQATAIGVLGVDAMGKSLKAALLACGAKVACVESRSLTTESKMRVLAGGISSSRQQMLRVDRGNSGPLPAAVERRAIQSVRRLAPHHDIVLVSDYGGGVLGSQMMQELSRLQRQGLRVAVDSRFQLTQFRGFSLLKPNEPELTQLVGAPAPQSAAAFSKWVKAARHSLGCEALLLTRGRHGLVLATDKDLTVVPAYGNAAAVDVTGAGDTVLATFAVAWAHGHPLALAAQLANVAGALVVQKPGTAVVSATELLHALKVKR
jgi:D-glycero-beta-D-manno-heptose-7-phosphate kinase